MIAEMTTLDILEYQRRMRASGESDDQIDAAMLDVEIALEETLPEAARSAARIRIGAGLNRLNGRSAS